MKPIESQATREVANHDKHKVAVDKREMSQKEFQRYLVEYKDEFNKGLQRISM